MGQARISHLDQQKSFQESILANENTRAVSMSEQQANAKRDQAILALDMQHQQALNQLTQQKQQQAMQIQQQAMQMKAQAQQRELQQQMQKTLMAGYGNF